jgi:isocitrate lyase
MGENLARQEAAEYAALEKSIEQWWATPRFKHTKRPFSAKQVASLRGTIADVPASSFTAKKLYTLLRGSFEKGEYAHTFGALDPVQVIQMAKYLSCVYVSGWQCSSTASTSNEPGPDFADYPADTVPNKVEQLFRAQMFHDRRQREERSRMTLEQRAKTPAIDFLRPIIADGDTGFGGVTSVMKLVKMHVLAGAAGIHIEDQGVGVKKCGHMGGKVLIPVREHIDRMSAARLQCDIMGVETVLIARTDACSATFLTTNIDPRDHPFILGSTVDIGPCEGCSIGETEWTKKAQLKTYPTAVADAMKAAGKSADQIKSWLKEANAMSNTQARARAGQLGFSGVFWCWDTPRAREGYYRVQGCTEYSIARAIAFAPVSDCIWMETATPDIHEADEFARGVHAAVPHQMLAYNLSPSFNWSGMKGMDDNAIRQFQKELGKRGFTWHFITLAGFHTNALAIDQFAKAYAGPDGVLSYVTMIQREEKRLNVETLTHQKWSGAELMDNAMMIATGGGSSTASLKGATEDQFHAKL